MADARELLVEWLRDAYAAEEQAQTLFSRTASQVDIEASFPETLNRHSARSEAHAERVKGCLQSLGESPSVIKTVTGQVVALAQSIAGYLVDDEPVKALLATATFARMQVTSFEILEIAARTVGEPSIAETCRSIHAEKEHLADWIEGQVATVTEGYLVGLRAI